MSASEPTLIAAWIASTFAADSGAGGAAALAPGGIHDDHAPAGASYPLVIFRHQGGPYVNGMGGRRIMLTATYAIYAKVQDTSYASAKPIAERLDALFHQKINQAVAGGTIISCVAEQPLKYANVEDGVEYRALGAIYTIEAQSS